MTLEIDDERKRKIWNEIVEAEKIILLDKTDTEITKKEFMEMLGTSSRAMADRILNKLLLEGKITKREKYTKSGGHICLYDIANWDK